jgi:hypothetical protein
MDKELKKRIIAYFKAQGLKFKYSTGVSKNPFFCVRFPMTDESIRNHSGPIVWTGQFSAKDRNMALDAIYGQDFKRDAQNPHAGNVSGHSIGMQTNDWIRFISNVERYAEKDGKFFFTPNGLEGVYSATRELYK